MDDYFEEEYRDEFNAHERSEFFSNLNVHVSGLYRQKTRELAFKIAEGILYNIADAMAILHIDAGDRSGYINDLQRVEALQYRSPVGLLFGWLAYKRSLAEVLKKLNSISSKGWPERIDRPRDIDVLRYMRFWNSILTPAV